MGIFPEKFRVFLLREDILKLLILFNLGGTAFGFYFYRYMLGSNPVKLWPFIPDSPLATLFMALSLTLYLKDRSNDVVNVFAFIGNLKYGLWTPFVHLNMMSGFLDMTTLPMYIFFVVSHLMMAAQAFLILEYTEFRWCETVLGLSWFLANDFVDYTYHVYANLPREVGITSFTAAVTFSLTFTASAILVVYGNYGKFSESIEEVLKYLKSVKEKFF